MAQSSTDRVRAALIAAGLPDTITEPGPSRTAAEAAAACACDIDQIVKSLIFAGADGGLRLFLTPGGRQLDPGLAAKLAGCALTRADAAQVRSVTGFAIGGVAPLGSLTPLPVFADPRFMDFETVFAAAGSPRHVFAIAPDALFTACAAHVAHFSA